jgi:hypothetical protein
VNRAVLIGAVLVLALLAAFYYFVDIRGREAEVEEQTATRRLVADFDRKLVRTVTIEPADGPALRVSRAEVESAWRVEGPGEVQADSEVVQWLLETLGHLAALDDPFPPGEDGLAPYGLAPPRLSVTVAGEGGAALARLDLGGQAPLGQARYAAVRDTGEVGQVSLAEVGTIPQTLFDLREKHLLRFRREEVRELRIEIAEQPALVIRRQGDSWDIVAPLAFAADRELVGSLLWELTECLALEFPVDGEAADLLTVPTFCIALTMTDGSETVARFGALADSGDGLFASGEAGTVMKVESTILDSALRPVNRWRELRPFPRYSWEVDRLTVALAGSGPVTWSQITDGVWQREGGSPDEEPMPEDTIRQALDLLTGLEACGLAGIGDGSVLAAADLAEPVFTVTLSGGTEEAVTVESLELGFPDRAAAPVPNSCAGEEPLVCGRRPGGDWIYVINEPGRDRLRSILETVYTGLSVEDGLSRE